MLYLHRSKCTQDIHTDKWAVVIHTHEHFSRHEYHPYIPLFDIMKRPPHHILMSSIGWLPWNVDSHGWPTVARNISSLLHNYRGGVGKLKTQCHTCVYLAVYFPNSVTFLNGRIRMKYQDLDENQCAGSIVDKEWLRGNAICVHCNYEQIITKCIRM